MGVLAGPTTPVDPRDQGFPFVSQRPSLSALHSGDLKLVKVCPVGFLKQGTNLWKPTVAPGSGYQPRGGKGTQRQASQNSPEPHHLASPPGTWSLHSTAGAHDCTPLQFMPQRPPPGALQWVCTSATEGTRPCTATPGPWPRNLQKQVFKLLRK